MGRQNSLRSVANLVRQNLSVVKQLYPALSQKDVTALCSLTRALWLSISKAELLFIEGHWYVTHSGLLQIALRRRCVGIHSVIEHRLCVPSVGRWVFKAIVFRSATSRGFVGYGDADPSNVSPQVRGAEMRVAETRAVNRALRKAYGIGICSFEELGSFSGPLPPAATGTKSPAAADRVEGNNHPLRDCLCLLIRKHGLDGSLVKAYAADYCEVSELRQASRQQIASFIKHLADYAQNDREGLLCQLNSYAPKPACSAPAIATAETSTDETRGAA